MTVPQDNCALFSVIRLLFCGDAFRLFPFSGGKERIMQIKYNDPYDLPQEIVIPDGDQEALKEVLDFLNEDARLVQNAERRERYHAPYHLDALDYEGSSIAYHATPEQIVIRKEDAEHIRETLSLLTETQRRRLLMLEEGMTLREIAKAEGAAVSSVKESLDAARKKFRENF